MDGRDADRIAQRDPMTLLLRHGVRVEVGTEMRSTWRQTAK